MLHQLLSQTARSFILKPGASCLSVSAQAGGTSSLLLIPAESTCLPVMGGRDSRWYATDTPPTCKMCRRLSMVLTSYGPPSSWPVQMSRNVESYQRSRCRRHLEHIT